MNTLNQYLQYLQFTESLPESPFTEAGLGITIDLESGAMQCSQRGWKQLSEWASAYGTPLLKWTGSEFEAQQLVAQFCLEQALINWVPRLRGYADEPYEMDTEVLPLPQWDWAPYLKRFGLVGELTRHALDLTLVRRTGYATIQPEGGPYRVTHLWVGGVMVAARATGQNPWVARTLQEQYEDSSVRADWVTRGKSLQELFSEARQFLMEQPVVSFKMAQKQLATKKSPQKR